ncbi:MAG: leucine-rich repeat domain-containing protein [Clostridia bacterium]|nr:leucine-rich repeat domain-containing protein [Clostridia bacterium]
MSPTNINIYVDGTLSKTIAKLGDSYTIDESEMPLDYEHCCGYFLDEELTKTIKNDTIDLTSAGQEITFAPRTATASSEGVNIYTRTADPSLFTFTTDGADGYIITKNSAVTYSGTEFNLVMPREYEDKTVTRIADSAFLSCSGLTSVIIPDGVTSIGELAFNGCSGLTSVIIPNSVTSLEALVFWGCSGLTSAYIPSSVTSIGSGLFIKCSSSLVIYTDVVDASSVSSGWEEFWNYYSGSEALTVNYGYTLEQYKSAVGLTFAPNGEKVSGAEVETAEEDKAYQVDNSYLQDVIFEIKYFILPKKIEIA